MSTTTNPENDGAERRRRSILIAEGRLNTDDEAMLAPLLGRLGLSAEFMTPEEFDAIKNPVATVLVQDEESDPETEEVYRNNGHSILNIREASQWLVKEHVRDYGYKIKDVGDKRIPYGRIFNYLLFGNNYGQQAFGTAQIEVNPLQHLIVKSRDEVGIEPTQLVSHTPIARLSTEYAIQAGSIIECAESLRFKGGKHEASNEALYALGRQLQSQVS